MSLAFFSGRRLRARTSKEAGKQGPRLDLLVRKLKGGGILGDALLLVQKEGRISEDCG